MAQPSPPSPSLLIVALVAMSAVAIVGVMASPANVSLIFGFCGTITGVMLVMLQQATIIQRIAANDQKTDEVASRISHTEQTVLRKGTEVKAALELSEAAKHEKLNAIEKKVEIIVQQTNGSLTDKLNTIKTGVDEVKKTVEGSSSPSSTPDTKTT